MSLQPGKRNRTFEYATVVNIVDGDTVDCLIDLGFTVLVKQRFRLADIDTPERGQPGFHEARVFLAEKTITKNCTLVVEKTDKYGRYLATLFVNDENINELMIASGLAKPYPQPEVG